MRLANSYIEIGEFLELRNLNKKGERAIKAAIQNNQEIRKLQSKIVEQNNLISDQTARQDEFGRKYLSQQEILLQTQIEMLQSQLASAQHREEQKIYRNQVFGIRELFDFFQKISDPEINSFFKTNYFDQTCTLLDNAKMNLDEFSDKDFCSKVLNQGRNQFDSVTLDYSFSPLDKFEKIIIEYEIKKTIYLEIENKISNEREKQIEDEKSLIEINNAEINRKSQLDKGAKDQSINRRIWRIVLIGFIVLALPSLFSKVNQASNPFIILIFIISLLTAIYFEVKYQKNKRRLSGDKMNNLVDNNEFIISPDPEYRETGHELQLENLEEELEFLEKKLAVLRNEIIMEHPSFFEMFEKIRVII